MENTLYSNFISIIIVNPYSTDFRNCFKGFDNDDWSKELKDQKSPFKIAGNQIMFSIGGYTYLIPFYNQWNECRIDFDLDKVVISQKVGSSEKVVWIFNNEKSI